MIIHTDTKIGITILAALALSIFAYCHSVDASPSEDPSLRRSYLCQKEANDEIDQLKRQIEEIEQERSAYQIVVESYELLDEIASQ